MTDVSSKNITREKLPNERPAFTHRFTLRGPDGRDFPLYITPGMYPDGRLGEVFIAADQQGTFLSCIFDGLAKIISLALQHGVPVKALVKQMRFTRFEPDQIIEGASDITACTSVLDYLAQYLELRFPDGTATTEFARMTLELTRGEVFETTPDEIERT